MRCSGGFGVRGLRPCRGCSAGISRTPQVHTLCRSQVGRVRMPEPANAQVSGIGESIVSPEDGARRCWAVAGRFRYAGSAAMPRPLRRNLLNFSSTDDVGISSGSRPDARADERAVSGTGDHLRSRTTGLSAGLRYMAGSSCRPTATMSRAVSAGWRCKGRPLSRLFDPSSPTCASAVRSPGTSRWQAACSQRGHGQGRRPRPARPR